MNVLTVNENLDSTEKFERKNQPQDENDDSPIVLYQFGDNNKIIFMLEDRRQLEVQSSGDGRKAAFGLFSISFKHRPLM